MYKFFLALVFLLVVCGICPSMSGAEQPDTEEITKLKEQILKNPDDVQSHRSLGLAYGKLGRDQESKAELEKAFSLKPGTSRKTPHQKSEPGNISKTVQTGGESADSLITEVPNNLDNQNKQSSKSITRATEITVKKNEGEPVTIKNPQEENRSKGNKKSTFEKIDLLQKAVSESNYMEALIEIIKRYFSYLIAIILLIILIGFLWNFILPSRRLAKELQAAQSTLALIKVKSGGPMVDLGVIARDAMISANLSHAWREFCHTLHPQKEKDESGVLQIVRYRATALAENFFSEQILVDTPLKTEFYKHLPGILTGLGIIGTFAGLIVGLVNFNITSDPDEIHSALKSLIHSVGHAFFVSGCAIGLAMLFTWREKSHVTERYKQVEELSQLIDSLFDSGAGEEYLEKLVEFSEQSATQATHIKASLVFDLKQILSELTAQQIEASARHSQQISANIGQAISDSLREPMVEISEAVKTVGSGQGEAINKLLTDVLANFSSQMQEIFGGQMRGMSDLLIQTSQAMQDAVRKFEELATKMGSAGKGAADAMADRLNQAINTMETRQNILNQKMGEFVERIDTIVNTSQTRSSEKLKDTLFKLDEHVAGIIGQLQEQSKDQEARQQDQNSRLSGQIESLLAQSIETSQSLKTSVTTLTEVTSSAITQMNSGAKTFYDAAKDFAKSVQGDADRLRESSVATEKMQVASQSLWATTTSIKQMLEDYKNTSLAFNTMISDLKSTVETAKREASLTSELVGQLKEASNQLGQSQKKAEEYLSSVNEVLTDAHQSFAQNIVHTLDKGNSQFYGAFVKAIDLLSGEIKHLGDTLDDFLDRRR